MQYRLHDAQPELWGWVKARAHVTGLTINDYILRVLHQYKTTQTLFGEDENKIHIPTKGEKQ
jgi:NRPS condensation-like uncharacterized protein